MSGAVVVGATMEPINSSTTNAGSDTTPIHWLLQSLDAHSGLRSADPPAGLLSPAEHDKFQTLKSPRRRQEWLLGRWTVKHLLRTLSAPGVSLDTIPIDNDDNGAPFTTYGSAATGRPFSISISHSHGYALCAAVEQAEAPVGADIEFVETRPARFVDDFFTGLEAALLQGVAGPTFDERVTAIWSAKEAALKAARIGLGTNTQIVSCLPRFDDPYPHPWRSFRILWHIDKAQTIITSELLGWWRIVDHFVLTLASNTGRKPA